MGGVVNSWGEKTNWGSGKEGAIGERGEMKVKIA